MSRLAAGLTAAMIVVGALTGCEKLGAGSVASSISPCFRILPVAHAAVGNQGAPNPADIVRVRGSAVPHLGIPFRRRARPGATTTTVAGGAPQPQRDVCLVAYRGVFDASRIPRLTTPTRTGSFAVVVVSVRTRRVLSVFLTDRLPSPMRAR